MLNLESRILESRFCGSLLTFLWRNKKNINACMRRKLASGQSYRDILRFARRHSSFLEPDIFLLEANEESSSQAKLNHLNRFLFSQGLSSVALQDTARPLYVNNIAAALPTIPAANTLPPKLTIILGVYNNEDTLEAAINSVLAGELQDFELIIVDDGSNDRSSEIAQVAAKHDSRISYHIFADNRGIYAARNWGLKNARGTFVAFQDADDWSHPERFSRCVQALVENSKLVAVSVGYVRIDPSGKFFSTQYWPITRWTPNSITFRREQVFTKLGYFEEVRFGADSEYVARLKAAFGEEKHLKLNDVLILAAYRKGSLTDNAKWHSADRNNYEIMWKTRLADNLSKSKSLFRG